MRRSRDRKIERRLRAARPEPGKTLVESLAAQMRGTRARSHARARIAFAGALTTGLLVALASVGGIGYAASSATQAVKVVKRVFVPSVSQRTIVVRGLSAGGDQYRPGYGWGDQNHNHTGPPGLTRSGGAFQPLLTARTVDKGTAKTVSFKVNLDEQAHLWISVLNPRGKALLLTQKSKRGGTKIGKSTLKGKQTKFIQYLALVPRSIPMSLRIPARLLKDGKTYRIRVVAKDPQGHKRTLIIPFRA